MGVADQIVDAGLVEEGGDELCWHCVERKRGDRGGCVGNGVQMGLKGRCHGWCACWRSRRVKATNGWQALTLSLGKHHQLRDFSRLCPP